MAKTEYVNSGIRTMAHRLQELVWLKERMLRLGPKSIRTARINWGSTEAFFDHILELSLQKEMVYKVQDVLLTIQPPPGAAPMVQMKLGDVGPI